MSTDFPKAEQTFPAALQIKELEEKTSWTDRQRSPNSEVSGDERGPQAF